MPVDAMPAYITMVLRDGCNLTAETDRVANSRRSRPASAPSIFQRVSAV